MQREDLLILRLPPFLASRLSAKLDDREKKRNAALKRRRAAGKSAGSAKEAIEAVWGEHGAPIDYDSTDEDDFLRVIRCVAPDDDDAEDASNIPGASANTNSTVAPGDEDLVVEYWCVADTAYIVRFGVEQFHATLTRLPCIVEAHKLAGNQCTVYKTGDVGQILIVHPEKVVPGAPRPSHLPNVKPEEFSSDGLTPPMKDVLKERYAKITPEYRLQEHGLCEKDIQEADERLTEFKDLLMSVHTKRKLLSGPNRHSATAKSSTLFVHEELIDGEPWMDYHPDSVIVIEQGDDNFVSSTKAARKAARDNKALQDQRFNEAVALGAPSPSPGRDEEEASASLQASPRDEMEDQQQYDQGDDGGEGQDEEDLDLDGDVLFEDDEQQNNNADEEDGEEAPTKSAMDLLNDDDDDDDVALGEGLDGDMV